MELLLGAINIAGDFAAVYVFTAKLKHGSRKNYALFLISALVLLCAAVRVEAIVLDRASVPGGLAPSILPSGAS